MQVAFRIMQMQMQGQRNTVAEMAIHPGVSLGMGCYSLLDLYRKGAWFGVA
jgi:hypothetical protein